MTKGKPLAPSHPWVQACCHLLQNLGVIILADQSITYYMLALCASHGQSFLCSLKARHNTLQRGYIAHFSQASSAVISTVPKLKLKIKFLFAENKHVVHQKCTLWHARLFPYSAFISNKVLEKIRLLSLRTDVPAFAEGVLNQCVCVCLSRGEVL